MLMQSVSGRPMTLLGALLAAALVAGCTTSPRSTQDIADETWLKSLPTRQDVRDAYAVEPFISFVMYWQGMPLLVEVYEYQPQFPRPLEYFLEAPSLSEAISRSWNIMEMVYVFDVMGVEPLEMRMTEQRTVMVRRFQDLPKAQRYLAQEVYARIMWELGLKS